MRTPLAFRWIESTAPTRTAYALHGIFGSGQNLQTFARRWVARFPEFRVALLDLRLHGQSPDGAPPHDIAACADDVAAMTDTLGPPALLLGHSFGGKVALEYAARQPAGLEHLFVLDTPPGAVADAALIAEGILGRMREVPGPFARREDLVQALVAGGLDAGTAAWLALNLRPREGGFEWRFDFDGLGALLADFGRRDYWRLLEAPPPGLSIDYVIGGRSDRIEADVRARLETLAAGGTLGLHVLPGAGHNLHVDDLPGLLDALATRLGGSA